MGNRIGVVHGRFQPFHLDHLKYVLAAKRLCDCLVVGITNSDPTLARSDSTNPSRSLKPANPLNYFERLVIVRESLLEAGIPYNSFEIVPFPINRPELIRFYVPNDAIHYITIYDDWGRRKLELLDSQGFDVVVLWEKPPEERGITATEVRQRIARGLPWEHFLPQAAARVIREHQLEAKIRQASNFSSEEYSL